MSPNGGIYQDGLRFAILNGILLVLVLIVFGIAAFLVSVIGWHLPLPSWVFAGGFGALVLALALVVWYRFSILHLQQAALRRAERRPDLVGACGALPFVGFAFLLAASGLTRLLLGLFSLEGDRISEGLGQLGIALLFVVISLG